MTILFILSICVCLSIFLQKDEHKNIASLLLLVVCYILLYLNNDNPINLEVDKLKFKFDVRNFVFFPILIHLPLREQLKNYHFYLLIVFLCFANSLFTMFFAILIFLMFSYKFLSRLGYYYLGLPILFFLINKMILSDLLEIKYVVIISLVPLLSYNLKSNILRSEKILNLSLILYFVKNFGINNYIISSLIIFILVLKTIRLEKDYIFLYFTFIYILQLNNSLNLSPLMLFCFIPSFEVVFKSLYVIPFFVFSLMVGNNILIYCCVMFMTIFHIEYEYKYKDLKNIKFIIFLLSHLLVIFGTKVISYWPIFGMFTFGFVYYLKFYKDLIFDKFVKILNKLNEIVSVRNIDVSIFDLKLINTPKISQRETLKSFQIKINEITRNEVQPIPLFIIGLGIICFLILIMN